MENNLILAFCWLIWIFCLETNTSGLITKLEGIFKFYDDQLLFFSLSFSYDWNIQILQKRIIFKEVCYFLPEILNWNSKQALYI